MYKRQEKSRKEKQSHTEVHMASRLQNKPSYCGHTRRTIQHVVSHRDFSPESRAPAIKNVVIFRRSVHYPPVTSHALTVERGDRDKGSGMLRQGVGHPV